MPIFASEADLLEAISKHDGLLRELADGRLSFEEFCEDYKDLYAFYALDGHESDDEERKLLEKHEALIEPHRVVAEDILSLVCSDEDATREIYLKAGRIGTTEAIERIRKVVLGEKSA